MLSGLRQFVARCKLVGIHKHEITPHRFLFNRDTVCFHEEPLFRVLRGRVRLVLTSPPYPAVHVLYHRWQVKGRKETLKAKARASRGRTGGAIGSAALDEFDRLNSKVDAVDAEAELDDELAKARHEDAHSVAVERKLNEMSKNKDLDDRLAALKAKMEKKSE